MLQFKKITVHNFGSYSHSEVNLLSRGFCLVSGKNNYKKDNALSNGSGKSFLWNAICFALTGETLNGLHSNLKNINIEENLCYVTIEFNADGDEYLVTRYVAPKSDLKIIRNGEDAGAKGIREAERKLGEFLPDITKDLLASTILIGQGMPNKFSSFSPSGRKELLERLTKSDFMIEDVKTRIANRQTELNKKIREHEDSLIAHNTQRNMVLASYNKDKQELQEAKRPDFAVEIETAQKRCDELKKQIAENDAIKAKIDSETDKINAKLILLVEEKASVNREELQTYTEFHSKAIGEKATLEAKVTSLTKEINRLKSIKDVCPTCGQKLPNVIKPNTDAQEAELVTLKESLATAQATITSADKKHQQYLYEITMTYQDKINALKEQINSSRNEALKYKNIIADYTKQLEVEESKLQKLIYDKENYDKYYENLQSTVAGYESALEALDKLIASAESGKDELLMHLSVIKKMDTLSKRDFRGYLLSNIIDYIDKKAKEYCEIVFETRELDVYLDDNSLDISYCGKLFDSLSGGEKQRVDLILQFAIRDMLNAYLGFNANIIVLDEITDFLDKKSCKAIMKLLEKELNTIESVFLISHHADELELPIDSEIKIIKNTDGISEVFDNAA